jgi:hypothetical protein
LENKEELDVYSTESFTFTLDKIEKQGRYFNPIMATLITGSARLIWSMAESIAGNENLSHYPFSPPI